MARRVDTRFLTIVTLVVVGALLAAFAVQRIAVRRDPQKHAQMARMLLKEGKVREACAAFAQATAQDPRDAALWVEFGDARTLLATTDPDALFRDRSAWSSALEADPSHMPALQRLLSSYWEESRYSRKAAVFMKVREVAGRIIQSDPADAHARECLHIATAEAWMSGMAIDEQQVDEAIKALRALAQKEGAVNPDVPYCLARILLTRRLRLRSDQQTQRDELRAQAQAVVEKALESQPPDKPSAALAYRAAQVYAALDAMGRPGAAPAAPAEVLRGRAMAQLEAAQSLARSAEPLYAEIHLAYAQFLQLAGQADKAEKVLQDLLAQRPGDPLVRLALGRLLRRYPARRDEAIRVLDAALTPETSDSPLRRAALRDQEIELLTALTETRLDIYPGKPAGQREVLLQQIQQGCQRIADRRGQTPEVLKLQGRLHHVQGQHVQAIQLLERAAALLDQQGRPKDDELLFALAQACADGQQTGQAKALCRDILERQPQSVPVRLLLVQLLLRENAIAEARPHVQLIEKQLPDSPQIKVLRLKTLDARQSPAQVDAYYADLPENDRTQKLIKAEMAIELRKVDEATRLLEALVADNPGDAEAALALARLHLRQGRRDEAQRIITEARAAKPDHAGLALAGKQLQANTPEELRQFLADEIARVSDDYQREIQLYRLAMASGRRDEAMEHLKKAQAAKPDGAEAMGLLFGLHVSQRDWGQASSYLERLAKADADGAGGLLYRFRMRMAQGDVAGATTVARELAEKMPQFAQSWVALGQALQAARQPEEALARYLTALEKQSTNAEALRGAIECYYALNRPDDAKRCIDQACAALPGNASFRDLQLNHELNHGDPAKAIAPLQERLKGAGADDVRAWLAASAACLRAAQSPTRPSQDALRYLDQGRETLQRAMQKWPDDRRLYTLWSDASLLARDWAGGEQVLRQWAQRAKDNPEPLLVLASFFGRCGKLDEAEKTLRQALTRSGNSVQVQQTLATFLAQVGKPDAALEVLAHNPDDARIQSQRAEIQLLAGRLADAQQTLDAALQKHQDDAGLWSLAAGVSLSAGKLDEASQRITTALSLDPANTNARYYRALLWLRQATPDADAALKELLVLRQENPDNIDVRAATADAYRIKNDPDSSIRELEAALALAPANKRVRMRLIDLYAASRPPRWTDVERLVTQAQGMPQLGNDPDWYAIQSQMHLGRGDAPAALKSIQQAMALAPASRADLIERYLDALLQAGNHQQLLDQTQQVLEQTGNVWWIRIARAVAYHRLKDDRLAMLEFEAALAAAAARQDEQAAARIVQVLASEMGPAEALRHVEPRAQADLRWRLVAARLYHSIPDDAKAAEAVEQVLAQLDTLAEADQLQALRLAAEIHWTARSRPNVQRALELYRQVAQRTPDDYQALNNLACVLVDGLTPPHAQEALVHSQRAYELMQKAGLSDPILLDTHGWVLTLCGRSREGIFLLRDAVQQQREPLPEMHYHLAEAYLRESFPGEALEQLDKAQQAIQAAKARQQWVDPALEERIRQSLEAARGTVPTTTKATSAPAVSGRAD